MQENTPIYSSHIPDYLSQRNNFNLDGSKNTNNQCMIASVTMELNSFGKMINDVMFQKITEFSYLNTFQSILDGSKKGTNTVVKNPKNKDRFWLSAHADVVNFLLKESHLNYKMVSGEQTLTSIKSYITKTNLPVILATDISQFLKGASGHIMVAIGYDSTGLYIHDPYGNCTLSYGDHNGNNIRYGTPILQKLFATNRECWYITKY